MLELMETISLSLQFIDGETEAQRGGMLPGRGTSQWQSLFTPIMGSPVPSPHPSLPPNHVASVHLLRLLAALDLSCRALDQSPQAQKPLGV